MKSTNHSVTNLEVTGPFRLRVFFDDDTNREIDFLPMLAGRLFSPLKDPSLFKKVRLENGFLTWPNGADISSDTLYHWPERFPMLCERAREWKRGFKAEDAGVIVFNWDEINETIDAKVKKIQEEVFLFI